MPNIRMFKINSEIAKVISQILNTQYNDYLSFPSINYVITSRDLKNTKVYVSFFKNNEQEFDKLLKIQHDIQQEFAKTIKLKNTPKIEFILDKNLDKINKVEQILDKLSKKDEN